MARSRVAPTDGPAAREATQLEINISKKSARKTTAGKTPRKRVCLLENRVAMSVDLQLPVRTLLQDLIHKVFKVTLT